MNACHNVPAVAGLFGVSESEIRRLAASKQIPHLRIGRRYVFTDDHVDQIRQRFEVPVTPVRALGRQRRPA